MAADWFYQKDGQAVGPMSAKELKWLASRGSIKGGSMVRRGASGEWFAAERLAAVLEPDPADEADIEKTHADDWRFTRDGRKLGPVAFSVLERLARTGRLKPTDTVWSPLTSEWTSADRVEGLFEPSTPTHDPPPTPAAGVIAGDLPTGRMPSRPLMAFGAVGVLLMVAAAGFALKGRSAHRGRAAAPKPRERSVVKHEVAPKADGEVDPPPALAIKKDPEADVRIAGPAATMRPLAATQRAPGHPRRGPDAAPTPRPFAFAVRPQVVLAERAPVPAAASPLAPAASIDEVLNGPEAFFGGSFRLDGLFKVGTRILDPMDKNGSKLGSTITVARDDDRTVSTLEGKVHGRELHMILDATVARNLRRLFERLRLPPVAKPTYKAILGVRVEPGPKGGDDKAAVIVIESLEILGSCDYYMIASRTFAEAFKVATVDVEGGRTGFGDGEEWVSRLGGEEKFVAPIRRKLRDLRRRIVNDATGAVADPALRRELDVWSRRATAIKTMNAIQAGGFRTGGR